jgi:hypothetical protein
VVCTTTPILGQTTLRSYVQNARKMKQIIEDIFPVIRDIDDHIDDFEEVDIV